ncbi:hypothetical protein Tco_1334101 [Tanacetum coccineum]
MLNALVHKTKAYVSLTYISVNKEGNLLSNVGKSDVNAVTWGVFPAMEIIQPTVVDTVVEVKNVEKTDTMAPNADDAINKELVNLIRLDKFNVAADLWDMFVLKSNGRNCMFKFNG